MAATWAEGDSVMVARRAQPAPDDLARPRTEALSPASRGRIERAICFGRGMGVALAILLFWSGAFALAWLVVPYVYLRESDRLARRRRMQG